jgi:peptidoglycan/LPS O-acetylase OafA/YrhL
MPAKSEQRARPPLRLVQPPTSGEHFAAPESRDNRIYVNVTREFVLLDGMRGLAALFIAMRHAPFLWNADHPETFLHQSYLAVDFFFSLSGFVLMHSYANRLSRDMTIFEFLVTRIARLYPLYFVGFLLAVIPMTIKAISAKISFAKYLSDLLCGVLFLPTATMEGALFPINPPAWSLFFEIIANLTFAFLIRFRFHNGLRLAVLFGSVALTVSASSGLVGFGRGSGPLDSGANWPEFGAGLIRAGFSFFAGTLVYAGYTLKRSAFKSPIWPISAVMALMFAMISWPKPPYDFFFDLCFVIVVFPYVVYISAKYRLKGVAAKLASLSGDASYAIYILQLPIYIILIELINLSAIKFYETEHRFIVGGACILTLLIIALFADAFLDRPLRRLFNKKYSQRAAGC